MVGQSFFFNAIFFSYGLIVKKFFGVSDNNLPIHLLPFAIASFLGPLLLGPLFDKHRPQAHDHRHLRHRRPRSSPPSSTPSRTASSPTRPRHLLQLHLLRRLLPPPRASYLTVSEIFPLEIRAFAIAIFYALGTLLGGVGAPLLFGILINTGSKPKVGIGYAIGAVLMLGAAVCEYFIGVEAAGQSLESISKPLQSK